MQVILLSGGSGQRLWPLSNSIRSKQFISLLRDDSGKYESMAQRVYRQINTVIPGADITIATSKSQVSTIEHQIGNNIGISVEPCRRDTFPAIVLANAFLHYEKHVSLDEPVVVCPVDPYVSDSYFIALKKLCDQSKKSSANLNLLGIEPTYPSEKYGYIIPKSQNTISRVETFKEKPDKKTAEEYLKRGALWNGGIFAFKLGYLLKRAHDLIKFDDYDDLYSKYETLDKISFDYAVVEHEPNIQVMRYSGEWKDLGTWNTLTEAMDEHSVGKVLMDESCNNVHVINELDVPVLAMGLNDIVVSASPEGILVSDKEASATIKPFVDKIHQQVMFAQKSWGNFRVLDITDTSLTMKVHLNVGQHMNYHSHDHRFEIWNVITGTGLSVVDGNIVKIASGDVVRIPVGAKHTVIAKTELQLVETQIGHEISVKDKKKFTFDFNSLI